MKSLLSLFSLHMYTCIAGLYALKCLIVKNQDDFISCMGSSKVEVVVSPNCPIEIRLIIGEPPPPSIDHQSDGYSFSLFRCVSENA
jgi:hypothetical protein